MIPEEVHRRSSDPLRAVGDLRELLSTIEVGHRHAIVRREVTIRCEHRCERRTVASVNCLCVPLDEGTQSDYVL